jgi:riboflavin synthase
MFTGIVESMGQIRAVEQRSRALRIVIGCGSMSLADVKVGDSIAVNGCCLTVVQLDQDEFHVDVSEETLRSTTGFADGEPVNLEKPLRLSDRVGGHLVSGHVDGTGNVTRFEEIGESWLLEVEVPVALAKYIARKGSITINGVSLTVNALERERFQVNLIPHTMQVTNLAHLRVGALVNLEVDLIARYIERLASFST